MYDDAHGRVDQKTAARCSFQICHWRTGVFGIAGLAAQNDPRGP